LTTTQNYTVETSIFCERYGLKGIGTNYGIGGGTSTMDDNDDIDENAVVFTECDKLLRLVKRRLYPEKTKLGKRFHRYVSTVYLAVPLLILT
jgi:hypothetical protein